MKKRIVKSFLLILIMLSCTACSSDKNDVAETNTSKEPVKQENTGVDDSTYKDEQTSDNNKLLIPDPMQFNSNIEYWDVEEIKSHKIKTEKKELRSLEEYYVPEIIPEGWVQDHIQVTEDYVAIFYRPEVYDRLEYDFNSNPYYSLCMYRKGNIDEIKERLERTYGADYDINIQEEQDCYIVDDAEEGLKYIYWAEREKIFFATVPLETSLNEAVKFREVKIQRVEVDNSALGNENEDLLIPDPMSNNPLICYQDIEEIISFRNSTDKAELDSLIEYYVPERIPEGWVQDHIQVTENFVAIFYRPIEYQKGEYDFGKNPYYSFCLNRKEKDSEIKDRLLATYGDDYENVVQQERDYYIVDDEEKNLKYIYWAQRGKSNFATMPLDATLEEVKSFCRSEIQRVEPWTTLGLNEISYADEKALKESIQKGDKEELKELTEYFVPERIPEGWVADHIRVKEYYAATYYRPSENKEENNQYYSFCWYRTETKSDIEDNLWRTYEEDYKTVVTEIEGFYIVDNEETKIKSIYWAQDEKSFFAKMPIDVTLEEIKSFCDAKEVKLID